MNALELLVKRSIEELREIEELIDLKEELYIHITNWLDEKQCPVCTDWSDEHAKHCTICDGTRKIYVDYSHLCDFKNI